MDARRRRFDAVSWLICTIVPTVPFAIASLVSPDPKDGIGEYVLGWSLAILYVCLPYAIYNGQVNRGKKPGALVFALITGLVFGFVLLLVWDLIRFVQSKIMNPGGPIQYAG